MEYIHVFPLHEESSHCLENGPDCFCEPEIQFPGKNKDARIVIHQELNEVQNQCA